MKSNDLNDLGQVPSCVYFASERMRLSGRASGSEDCFHGVCRRGRDDVAARGPLVAVIGGEGGG
jgi:hypothetical protein